MSFEQDAGEFSEWLLGMQAILAGSGEADVPCGTCTACCSSSQFVHIAPDETDALAHIPRELLFPAPGLPRGNVVLGYDEHGRCPMLTTGGCSIYAHRPRTCRTYDCRVFPAAGVAVEEQSKAPIAAQVQRWRFRFPRPQDRVRHQSVVTAAVELRARHPDASPTQLAVQAVATARP